MKIWLPGPPHRPSPTPVAGETEVIITSSVKDGHIRNDDANYNTARTDGTGDVAKDDSVSFVHAMAVNYWSGVYNVYRSFFYFDLSSVPAGKTVTEVALLLTELVYHNTGVAVYKGTQAATLTIADFDSFEGDAFANQAFVDGENKLTFNAAGKQYVENMLGSAVKLCCRESDFDVAGAVPAASTNHRNGCYYAEASESQRPRLKITYI